MAALGFPRDVFMEMYLGAWRSVTSSIRQTDPLTITRGRSSEQSDVAPSTLTCKLDNTSGDFTSSNPLGQWFGQMKKGTPMRFGIKGSRDNFTRTVSNSWGNADSGETWDNNGSGGTVAASDWNVAGGKGTHSVPSTLSFRWSILPVSLYNVEVAVTTTVGVTDVTGGAIEPGTLICRFQDPSNYYMARVSIGADELDTLSIWKVIGGVGILLGDLQIGNNFGIVGQPKAVRVKMQVQGETIRMKAYQDNTSPFGEPVDWMIEVHDNSISAPGGVGVRNGNGTGNSNAKPIVYSNDNFEIRHLRFSGEIAELKPRWSVDHADRWVELTGSTVLRRIMQGKTPLKSTLRRGYLANAIASPIQYWPCEEQIDSQQIQSAIDNNAMNFFSTGRPRFGANTDFIGSSPLPIVNASQWNGFVTPYISTGEVQLRFLLEVPSEGLPDNTSLAWLETAGSLHIWEIFYKAGGSASVNITDSSGTLVLTGGPILLNLDGALARVSLQLSQNGGNVDWGLSRFDVITLESGGAGASQAGTLGIAQRVIIGPRRLTAPINNAGVGHVVVQKALTDPRELQDEYGAWRGESPIDRANRLCVENGIQPIAYMGSTPNHAMGPQAPSLLTTLIRECQNAAQGTIHEDRGAGNKLMFRPMNAIFAQNTKMIISYANEQISEPFQPSDDDKPIRNDVTAKRTFGGEFRMSQETGPNNAQEPGADDDAVGRYDQEYNVNCQLEVQLPDVAGWELHLGTTEAERWPKLKLNMRAISNSSDALQGDILDLELDDRITVTGMSEVGYYDDIDLILRGYAEVYNDQYQHTITFNSAPYDPYNVGILDNAGSRLSDGLSELVSSLTTSATSFQVDGELWTVNAGDFPMNIKIGGEVIRLSSITGASIPQTFNVDVGGRAVNGVVKAHSAGDRVDIAVPVYLGR